MTARPQPLTLDPIPGPQVVRSLTTAWMLALAVVAVLSLSAQVIIQKALARAELDARVVNLAGRQRMLSQAMTKAALIQARAPSETGAALLSDWRRQWRAGHALLADNDSQLPGAGPDNSAAVAEKFAILAPIVERMFEATGSPMSADDLDQLLLLEPDFLTRMDELVDRYQAESTTRISHLRWLEAGIGGVLLLVLIIEAAFVFRPTVVRLREGLALHERLAEEETAHRVLAAEARLAERIGHDLHDGLGQTLTALSMQIAGLERQHDFNASGIQASLTKAIAETRAVARRLAPAGIHLGLAAALDELARATSVGEVACLAHLGEEPRLSPAEAEDAIRLAQEAVTNALRHGRATRIDVTLTSTASGWSLTIDDDGCGLPSHITPGLGLDSMRMRARRLGGHLELLPAPLGGLRVMIDVSRPC